MYVRIGMSRRGGSHGLGIAGQSMGYRIQYVKKDRAESELHTGPAEFAGLGVEGPSRLQLCPDVPEDDVVLSEEDPFRSPVPAGFENVDIYVSEGSGHILRPLFLEVGHIEYAGAERRLRFERLRTCTVDLPLYGHIVAVDLDYGVLLDGRVFVVPSSA